MKKFAIGCAVAVLVLLVLVAAGGIMVWNKYVKPMTGSIAELSQIAEIEKAVRNTASFTAPDTGELTEEMVVRFVRVQEAMQARLGPQMTELKAKYDKIEQAMKANGRQASFVETMGALKDLSSIVVVAKKAQVEGLNAGGFSVEEYEWIRRQVYAAAGIVTSGFDLKRIKEVAQEAGRGEAPPEEPIAEVPDRNKALVAPYAEKLKEWAALAFFGL